MGTSGKFNSGKNKKWCSFKHTSGHSDEECFKQMEKSERLKKERQKNDAACTIALVIQKYKGNFTVVDYKNRENMKPIL